MQMNASGAPLTAIRTAIETKYRPHFATMTPTPPIGRQEDEKQEDGKTGKRK
jgi:hypothetical protein